MVERLTLILKRTVCGRGLSRVRQHRSGIKRDPSGYRVDRGSRSPEASLKLCKDISVSPSSKQRPPQRVNSRMLKIKKVIKIRQGVNLNAGLRAQTGVQIARLYL